jgi:ribosomal protein S18 acetylase RimI-like enzyme
MNFRPAVEEDLAAMVSLAAGEQARGDRHIGYLGLDAQSIEKDVTGVENWQAKTAVAIDGRVVGWLLCETDDDMGRGWWWGPFVVAADWSGTADALYETAAVMVGVTEEEQAPDSRNELAAAFALRQGFRAETASAVLSYHGPGWGTRSGTEALNAEFADRVASLHDALFPNTHTTGKSLVASDDIRLVVVDEGVLRGYVAAEIHSDGTGYIDYLGVAPAARRQGIGARLVQGSVDALLASGARSAHLTVRESNHAARALYASLGFTEERVIRPYRKNFSLEVF